jgi:hypothetical protein
MLPKVLSPPKYPLIQVYGTERELGIVRCTVWDQNSLHTMAPVFLHISRKLLSVLPAEQRGAYSLLPQFARFIVRRCVGTEVFVAVQTPIRHENCFAIH